MAKGASFRGLRRLLKPRHVAVFGGEFAAEVIRQSERIGFPGEIWPVNPNRAQLAGRRCYAAPDSLPEPPDASFVAVPREATVEVVAALARIGAGGAVCYASGFAEAGAEGRALQTRLQAAMGDLAVVGPNCYGLLNYLDGAALWPDQHGGRRMEEGVAIVTQSGNVGISLTMQQRSLPLAYLISVGNQAGLAIADYVSALVDDPRVKAVGLVVETLGDIAGFSRAALAARDRRVPLVALKVGRSALGARAALSHTSSLTGDDGLYDALFRKLGVARVHSLSQFLETLKLLAVTGALPGNRISSISCSGGEAALVADMADGLGLEMPAFTPAQVERLEGLLGPLVAVANPLDYHTFIWGQPESQRACFAAVMEGEQDVTVKVFDYVKPDVCDTADWDRTMDAFIAAQRASGKPAVVVSTISENLPERVRERLIEHGITPLQGLEDGLIALKAASEIGRLLDNGAAVDCVPVPSDADEGTTTLDEWQSKRALGEFGLVFPQGRLADAASVVEAAEAIGYPVALKAVSPELYHKSDVGGVALNLTSAEEVARAAGDMSGVAERFLVEAMAPAPVAELLVGITRDSQFGLALTFGAGGVLVELMDDTRTLLFPVSKEEVARALGELRIARLIGGFRGRSAGDVAAAVDAIMAVAAYAQAHAARIVELDVNPLLILPEGQGAMAVDALIRLTEENQQ